MQSVLFIFSGLPGTGKSTLSQFLAGRYKMAYLRIDTIEQGLRDLYHADVVAEGYELAYRIAAENLKSGIPVVADSCNPILLTRRKWEEVAENSHSFFMNIEVVCSDREEHRQRIENRISEVENLKLPTWHEIKNREFHPWKSDRISVDTAHTSIEESQQELDEKVCRILREAKIEL